MKRMRVLFVPSGDDKYGAPKSMMELVGNLKERHGVEPIIMTCNYGKINEWCKENSVKCYVLGQPAFMVVGGSNRFRKIVKHSIYPYLKLKYILQDKKACSKIEKLLEKEKIDIVHTNVNRVDVGGYYAKKHGIPHVMHLREFGKEDYNCMFLRCDAIRFLNDTTTKFVAISNAVKYAWAEKGVKDDKIEVVYNGIDFSRFPIILPPRVSEKNNTLQIVFAGIISETKGQYQLIRAIECMPEHMRKRVHIDFYGGGREQYINFLKKYTNKNDLNECIAFKGYCSELPKILPDYDVGVVASRAEAFGRVTAEYMAAGLCVIASDTGANPEIVLNQKTGLIYPFGNIHALADCIKTLLENPEMMRNIRVNAFEDVREKYTMDRCADEIYSLYERILQKK